MRTNQIVAKTLVCVAVAGWLGMSQVAEATELEICGKVQTETLWAGQHIDAGIVDVLNTETHLCALVTTIDDWLISEYHVAIVTDLSQVPTTRQGNPIPGQFPISGAFDPPTDEGFAVCVPLEDLELEEGQTEVIIAVHAVVVKVDAFGVIIDEETAWGGDEKFGSRRWAYYITYSIQECEDDDDEEIEVGDFRTQTQGGWGTGASGNNPGAYRDANFADAFPDGVVIGCVEEYTATFNSSAAVEDFLPDGGPKGVFTESHTNPTSTEAGVLAGQILALTLSVGFDLYDEDFGASDVWLGDLIVNKGKYEGYTVAELLDYANAVLGGCEDWDEDINDEIDAINNNFVDGEDVADPDLLRLP